jgi:hypothetical protein
MYVFSSLASERSLREVERKSHCALREPEIPAWAFQAWNNFPLKGCIT